MQPHNPSRILTPQHHHNRRIPRLQQIRYVNDYLSKKERWFFRVFFALFLLSLSVTLVRAYQGHVTYTAADGGKYTEGIIGAPKWMNPLYAATNDADQDMVTLVYSQLFKDNAGQGLIPDAAESYTISEDKKTYTVLLRKDIIFQNVSDDSEPQQLTADDVIFTIGLIQDPLYASPLRSNFSEVTVQRVDDFTVSFTLKEPYAPFLTNLTFGILPAYLWIDVLPENARLVDLNLKPIGSGPYAFKELKKDPSGSVKSITVVPNAQYYGDKPHIDELTFKYYPDIDTAAVALQEKNVEGLSFISASNRETLKEQRPDIQFHTFNLPQYTAIFFNQTNSLLKNAEVREALALAIHKDEILDQALNNEGQIIHAPVLPGFVGYNPDVRKYNYDPTLVSNFLNDKGWVFPQTPEGQEAPALPVRQKDGVELALSLSTIDQEEYVTTVELIKKYWEAVGVRVELKIYSTKDIQKKVIAPRQYEALLFGEIVGADPDPYPFWHSSQNRDPGLNLAVFFNKQVDQLLEEARQTDDSEQRRLKYLHFQNILADELPAIFLYNPTYTYPVHDKVKGMEGGTINILSDRFSTVSQWYIETSRNWTWNK